MNWKGYGRKRSWPSTRYCPGICLEGPGKTMNLSQDNWSPSRDLNPRPPEYEAAVCRHTSCPACRALFLLDFPAHARPPLSSPLHCPSTTLAASVRLVLLSVRVHWITKKCGISAAGGCRVDDMLSVLTTVHQRDVRGVSLHFQWYCVCCYSRAAPFDPRADYVWWHQYGTILVAVRG
jgi:hypothetical protein